MEQFSDSFIRKNRTAFEWYSRKWVLDPLHQWSRIWEYPFVYDRLLAWRMRCAAERVSVLDAGSGMTFFPFFLAATIPTCGVVCVDTDVALGNMYARLVSEARDSVHFTSGDLQHLPFPDCSLDAVYCVSVLEHLGDATAAIEEIARVLRPHGIFVATFDVSLDSKADIPLAEAKRLISRLQGQFACDGPTAPCLEDLIDSEHILTTALAARVAPATLPWKLPNRSLLARLLRRSAPLRVPKLLTVYGEAYAPRC